jgi:hypothetical protein
MAVKVELKRIGDACSDTDPFLEGMLYSAFILVDDAQEMATLDE